MTYALLLGLMAGSLGAASAPADPPVPPKRAAVLVGANKAAAGRRDLRFSYRDAEQMASVLREAGRFAPAAVRVLRDPAPHEVLAALDDAIAELSGAPE
jgi:hypothetical protein